MITVDEDILVWVSLQFTQFKKVSRKWRLDIVPSPTYNFLSHSTEKFSGFCLKAIYSAHTINQYMLHLDGTQYLHNDIQSVDFCMLVLKCVLIICSVAVV